MAGRGQTVVVTGASAGVGRAVAQRFARDGARVALLARGEAGLAAAAAEVEALGGTALPISVDVTDDRAVDAAADHVERELGEIDVWINNAMATIFGPVRAVSPEEFRRATEVTYFGYVYGTMSALRRMTGRNRGVIVQVGSALSYRAIPLQATYCGAKFAIRGFTDSIRTELMHDNSDVHVTMVQLPAVNTPQFGWGRTYMPNKAQPVPPIFQPEIVADGIHWAAHQRKREVWIGAPTIKAIVAQRLVPWALDRYLARTGYSGQQTPVPADEDAPDNLFTPVDDATDAGTHGAFDDQARSFDATWLMTRHKKALMLAGAATASAMALSRR